MRRMEINKKFITKRPNHILNINKCKTKANDSTEIFLLYIDAKTEMPEWILEFYMCLKFIKFKTFNTKKKKEERKYTYDICWVVAEYFLWTRHCVEYFAFINSFNSHNNFTS